VHSSLLSVTSSTPGSVLASGFKKMKLTVPTTPTFATENRWQFLSAGRILLVASADDTFD
jgi:hypothetical protein